MNVDVRINEITIPDDLDSCRDLASAIRNHLMNTNLLPKSEQILSQFEAAKLDQRLAEQIIASANAKRHTRRLSY